MRKIRHKISNFLLYGVIFSLVAYVASLIPHKGADGFTHTPPLGPPTAFADDPHSDGTGDAAPGDSCDAGDAADCV